ncbi:F0F1 ATP synthase subunit epsilon [Helicobacter anseris]|uniref:ATP synthase epsilon chain n=1 Tax=Helicobacter anseris TaxID=375926 RepID=A0A3D8JCS6_9HELI|nr:ATP synthase F1 subunit epsilon [Helicobacter anseris]RDU74664.1 F0F1 ATP synthase subunit epsilon [Helicobacter anseris]
MSALMVSIVTPYGKIFDGSVTSITLPGVEGEFGVIEGHSDLLSLLKTGVIEIIRGEQRDLVAINWGYAKVQSQQVDVLVDGAVLISEHKGDIAMAIENAKKLLEDSSNDKIAISGVVSKIDNMVKGK